MRLASTAPPIIASSGITPTAVIIMTLPDVDRPRRVSTPVEVGRVRFRQRGTCCMEAAYGAIVDNVASIAMVNPEVIQRDTPRAAERALILGYAPVACRAALAALLALDDRLAAVLQTTREPLVGQMRLTWWHEALSRLDAHAPPAEPVLTALARDVVRRTGAAPLADLVEGWEALLDMPLDREALERHARSRGAGLFRLAATVLAPAAGDDPRIARAGEGWALADLSRHVSDTALAAATGRMAVERLEEGLAGRWPVRARALGAMAHLARIDLTRADRPEGHPARAARILWHRATGR
ncbi:squalene/phytoene synthase family protein [Sphingomonas adhaesiva]|uniref:squalene/phytoene synthase family protein n=1 Tax=Sphingomonas adhaesiva TaxID=28212 RepID=UPI002FFCFA49